MALRCAVISGVAAWLTLSGAAAADMAVPPTALAAQSWAGFYFGIHGGAGRKHNDFTDILSTTPFATVGGIESKGRVIGGHAGYNWQSGHIVSGIEIDFSATSIKGASTPASFLFALVNNVTAQVADNVKYLGTARARFGLAPIPEVLLYGTGGLAWERVERTNALSQVSPFFNINDVTKQPFDRFGWVAGVGAEVTLGSPNWIARAEYLHYDFGVVEATETAVAAGQVFAERASRQTINVGRAGLSYKFGGAAAASPDATISKAPSAVAPAVWAGFYLGGHAGTGRSHNDFSLLSSSGANQAGNLEARIDGVVAKGALVGGHAGYNWQFGGAVAGLELDFSVSGLRGTSAPGVLDLAPGTFIAETVGNDIKYLGTARTRLGFLANPDVLLYATAGLAWERLDRVDTFIMSFFGTTTTITREPQNRLGWAAGGGAEVMLGTPNRIGRLEYLHYDFGMVESISLDDRAKRQTINVGRVALSYKFGDSAASASAPSAAILKAPAVTVAETPWAGFYLGIHGGYGGSQNDFSRFVNTTPRAKVGGIIAQGTLFGGQTGYNWQYGGAVVGLELDFSASRIRGESAPVSVTLGAATAAATVADDVKYLGTLRARLGALPVPNLLLYGTAGLAWEKVDRISAAIAPAPPPPMSDTLRQPNDRFGLVAGVGAEMLLGSSNWIGRLEYLHYGFGTVEVVQESTGAGITTADRANKHWIDVGRLAVSYKIAP
jgi:opacity protein-like surface antigen